MNGTTVAAEALVPFDDVLQKIAARSRRVGCGECGRMFDLHDETDAQEWAFGHDCEA